MNVPRRRDITVGSLLQLVIRVAGMASGALVAALQARTLSVAEFGVLSTIFTINALAITLSDMGIMNTSIRRLAADPADRANIISGLLAARLFIGLFLTASGIAVSALIFDSSNSVWAAVFVLASLPLGSLTAMQALSQARLQFFAVNSLLILQNFLWAAVVAVLAAIQAPLLLFAMGFLFCAFVQGCSTWLLCGRGLEFSWRAGLAEVLPLVRQALPLGVGSLAVTAYYRLTGLILFMTAGPEAAGNFSAAFRFLDVLQAIPATLAATLVPLMAQSFSAGNGGRVKTVWRLALKLLLTASVFTSLAVGLLSEPIVELLYGAKYGSSSELLAILMLAFPGVCLGWLLTGVITSKGEVKKYSFVACWVALISSTASILIIPVFAASGAAWVTVGTEMLMVTLLCLLVYRSTRLSIPTSLLLRLGAAAASTSVIILLVEQYGLWWSLTVGGLSAAGTTLALRVVSLDDIKTLLQPSDLQN